MINEQAIKEYVENQGEICPLCKEGVVNRDFETSEHFIKDGVQIREDEVYCWKCKEKWTDIYQLVSIRV